MELNPVAVLLAVAAGVPAFTHGRKAVRYWRIPSTRPPQPPLLGRFSPEVRQALERTELPYACVMGSISVLMLAAVFLPASTRGAHASFDIVTGVAATIGGIALIGLFTAIALTWTIVWFNRPGFLVPPHRRDDLGVRALRRLAQGDQFDGHESG